MVEQVIKFLEGNIHWIAPLALPIVFVGFSALFQWQFGQNDFRFLGGEVSLAATASLLGSVLHTVLGRHAGVERVNALGIVGIVLSLVVTFFCYSMGRPYNIRNTVLSACLGTFWFYLSAVLSWHILSVAGNP
jgi:hypothetical protein